MHSRYASLVRSIGSSGGLLFGLAATVVFAFVFAGSDAKAQTNSASPFVESSTLTRVRGVAADIAIAVDGTVYTVDPEGAVWVQKTTSGGTWTRLPGLFRAIRAGFDGSVRGIGVDAQLYVLTGSWWRSTGAVAVRDVAVTPDGNTYVLSLDGTLESQDGAGELLGRMERAETGDFQNIAVDEHGLPWLWNTRGDIRRFDGLNWVLQNRFSSVGIRSLASSNDGTVLLIDGNGAAHRWRSQSTDWQPEIVTEPMRAVAIGPAGKPWYLSENGSLWASASFSGAAVVTVVKTPALFTRLLSWRRVNGQAESLSVGADATVMSIDAAQNAWRWKGKEGWTPLPGKFKRIAAGRAGSAWGIDGENRVLRYASGQWFDAGVRAAEVAVGPQGDVWVISSEGAMGRYDARAKIWDDVPTPGRRARAIAVGNTGNSGKAEEPWIIDAEGLVSRRIVDRWVTYSGIVATSLAVGPEGTVYATTAALELFWFDLKAREWKPATGVARSVAVGPAGTPWMVGPRSDIYVSTAFLAQPEVAQVAAPKIPMQSAPALISVAPPAASILPQLIKPLVYTTIPGNYVDVGIGADGSVFAAGVHGGLYCFDNASKRFQFALPGTNKKIAVSSNGAPWLVDAQGRLLFFEKNGWQLAADFKAADVAIGSDGSAYAVNAVNDQVYRYSSANDAFELVTTYGTGVPLRAKSIAFSAGQLWAVTPSKQLLKCARDRCELQAVSATDVASGPEGSVFITDLAGGVQRWNPRGGGFISVKGGGVALSVGPQGLPWLVTSSGQIQSSGLFSMTSKTINTGLCAQKFQAQPVPQVIVTAPPASVVTATADAFVLNPGDSASVLSNDRLNGAVPTVNSVRITLAASSPLLSLVAGRIVVAPGAPSGSVLTATYSICAALDLTKCATAGVTVTVPSKISATADVANLAPGATFNLLANDNLNGAVPSSSQVIVNFSSASAHLQQTGGLLTLAATAPPGSIQTASYSICVALGNSSCSDPVSVTVNVASTLTATADTVSLAPGGTFNLLANDLFNGTVALPSQVNITFATASAFLSQSGGVLRLAINAPTGSTQRATYSLCNAAGSAPCSGPVNVVVTVPAVISVGADSATLQPSDTLNLLANDQLNGAVPQPSAVVFKFQTTSSYLSQVGGLLTVSANAPRGTQQTATYSLCLAADSNNCSASTSVTITIASRIGAVADVAILAPGQTLNLLANDTLNGVAPTTAQVAVVFNSSSAYLSEARGVITLNSAAPLGTTQNASYRICERSNPTNCSGVVAVVATVQSTISAVADTATLNPGGTINLLANDRLNGVVPLPTQVVITFTTASPYLSQIGGVLTLAANAPGGSTQTATYSICQSPGNILCSATVSVTITVAAAAGTIAATSDTATLPPGGNLNLLANDSLNGVAPVASQVTVTFSTASVYLNQTGGLLTLAAGAPAGSTQTATYSICQSPANTLCSATVAVTINVPGAIVAVADTATLSPGGTLNLLANDSLNGAVPLLTQVTVTFNSASPHLSQVGGLLTLAAAAPAGSLQTATYSICQAPANTLCSGTVNVTITVPAVISAVADAVTLSPGGTLNLLANDSLNGAVPLSSQVAVTFNTASAFLTQTAGLLTLAAGVPSGSVQTATYSICQTPANTPCSGPVSVTITVPSVVTAVADAATLIPDGTLNLLANDSLNGAVPLSSQVVVTFNTASAFLSQTGGVLTLAAGAPGGSTQTATYSICQSPANTPCSATVAVTITVANAIAAVADVATINPGGTLNLLANDVLNGAAPLPSQVAVTFNTASPTLLSQSGGVLTLSASALGGNTLLATYSICQLPANTPCSGPVNVTITVTSSITAVADTATVTPGGTLNLFANDNLNGDVPMPGQVTVTFNTASAYLTQANGVVTLAAGAPAGAVQTATYRICVPPANTTCSATVAVTITAPVTAIANPDGPVILTRGIGAGIGLHLNDTLNGVLIPPGAVNVQYTLNDNTATFILSANGYLELFDDLFAIPGIYTLSYTFCEAGVPTNCSSTTATINVQAP